MKGKISQKKGKNKYIMIPVMVIILLSVVILGIGITAGKNVKVMNQCVDAALEELGNYYNVVPRDAGEYDEMKIYGIMKFDVEQYEIETLGNLSVMRVNMGFMQMATFVITPREKNLPLLSADYMYIMGKRKSYLEFYDVVKEKEEQYQDLLKALQEVHGKYEHLENITPSKAWYENLLTVTAYKAGTAAEDQDLQGMLTESVRVYLKHSEKFPVLEETEREEKIRITQEYTDGLIEKGGISTDVFKNALGEEKTKMFFDKVFFGTAME